MNRRLGGPQGQSEQVWKISLPLGFDPRTAQPVASRYTDYTTRPTHLPTVHVNILPMCAAAMTQFTFVCF
jgi:hypothetical protein